MMNSQARRRNWPDCLEFERIGAPKEGQVLVFVYGSLRKKCGWNFELYLDGSDWVGDGVTINPFGLFACPETTLPYLTRLPVSPVVGEVWAVSSSTLALIDRLERDAGYQRDLVTVAVGDERVVAGAYFWDGPLEKLTLIECGDWASVMG